MTENIIKSFNILLCGFVLFELTSIGNAMEVALSESNVRKQEIFEAKTWKQVESFMPSNKDENLTIGFDVDDTIWTCLSSRVGGPIDTAKKEEKITLEDLEIWRASRSMELLDNEIPKIIAKMQEYYPVIAITKLALENVKGQPVADWRVNELKAHGIQFSEQTTILGCGALLKNGCYITGPSSKAKILEQILEQHQYKKFIFVDDRYEELDGIKKICAKRNVEFTGIHLTQVQNKFKEFSPDKNVEDFQMKTLSKEHRWVEYEAAKTFLKNSQSS